MYRLNEKSRVFIHKWKKRALLSAIIGFLSGTASTVFLLLLEKVTAIRENHLHLIYWLPLAGWLVGVFYLRHGKDIAGGNNLILEEIHQPKNTIPFRMVPFVLFGTLVTHLFGGSAGREGTAVQMGGSLADQVTRFFNLENEERKNFLIAGIGAGFGSAIGAPWAGVIFGMEVIQVGRMRFFAWFECLVATFVAYYTTFLFKAPHTHYPQLKETPWSLKIVGVVILSGVVFGLTARLFSWLTHSIEKIEGRWISYPPAKPLVGGVLLVVLFSLEGSYRYAGLGIPIVQDSLSQMMSFKDPLFKILFTALTVASGFKGGEFIPLVFIGSSLGSALSQFVSTPQGLLASVGFAAVFASASNTPIACSVMAIELLGWHIAPYAVIGCCAAYYFSGQRGIYSSQLVSRKKLRVF